MHEAIVKTNVKNNKIIKRLIFGLDFWLTFKKSLIRKYKHYGTLLKFTMLTLG